MIITVIPTITTPVSANTANYAQLLQYALYFFDGNMCGGNVRERSAFAWRDNCHHANDSAIEVPSTFRAPGGASTIDLSGGYHDAGDHIKFGIPIGVAGITVGMARMEFPDSFTENGLDGHAKRILDHFAEYYRKCVIWNGTTPHAFAYQVGDGHEAPSGWGGDHTYWGAPELQTGSAIGARRRARFTNLTGTYPGTDQVAVASALLALNYINYRNPEDLRVSRALYDWAQAGHKGVARDGTTPFYQSSRWDDKMALAAELLFIATGEQSFVTQSMTLPSGSWDHHSSHPVSWDGVWPFVNTLRGIRGANSNGNGWEAVRTNMNPVNSRLTNTAFFEPMSWGNTRYNCGFQFLGLMHQKHNPTHDNNYLRWAEGQMSFITGNNSINGGTSFVVGINAPWASNAHHRAASGFADGWTSFNANRPVRNTFIGALIGGPVGGRYADNISEYQYTEVACDYNAMLIGAAAGLWHFNRSHRPVAVSSIPGDFRTISGGDPIVTTATTTSGTPSDTTPSDTTPSGTTPSGTTPSGTTPSDTSPSGSESTTEGTSVTGGTPPARGFTVAGLALESSGWSMEFTGDVTVGGNGTHNLTINTVNPSEHSPGAATAFRGLSWSSADAPSGANITLTGVRFNDTAITVTSGLGLGDIWVDWNAEMHHLTGGHEVNGNMFGLPGGGAISTVTLVFTVSGLAETTQATTTPAPDTTPSDSVSTTETTPSDSEQTTGGTTTAATEDTEPGATRTTPQDGSEPATPPVTTGGDTTDEPPTLPTEPNSGDTPSAPDTTPGTTPAPDTTPSVSESTTGGTSVTEGTPASPNTGDTLPSGSGDTTPASPNTGDTPQQTTLPTPGDGGTTSPTGTSGGEHTTGDSPTTETTGERVRCPACNRFTCVCEPDTPTLKLGDINGNNRPEIEGAVEILKFIVGLPSIFDTHGAGSPQWNAALITDGDKPGVDDAIEILKWIVGLPNRLTQHWS
jgi:hypothetical protein